MRCCYDLTFSESLLICFSMVNTGNDETKRGEEMVVTIPFSLMIIALLLFFLLEFVVDFYRRTSFLFRSFVYHRTNP